MKSMKSIKCIKCIKNFIFINNIKCPRLLKCLYLMEILQLLK